MKKDPVSPATIPITCHHDNRVSEIWKNLIEIQTGPTPLTPDEIRRLAASRPRYAFLAQWADRMGVGR